MAMVSSNSSIVTPRPEMVYGTCNSMVVFVHQKIFLVPLKYSWKLLLRIKL